MKEVHQASVHHFGTSKFGYSEACPSLTLLASTKDGYLKCEFIMQGWLLEKRIKTLGNRS